MDGADIGQPKLGPLSDAVVSSGRAFTAADADKNVALVDKGYAASNGLKVGGTMKIGGTSVHDHRPRRAVGGQQPAERLHPPRPRAGHRRAGPRRRQPEERREHHLRDRRERRRTSRPCSSEIARLLPTAQLTTPSSLANQVTGSLTSAAKLANDLGKWLSILVLIAAFAVAVLLTMAAVARRVREFGTLKALGWRGRRIIAQVMGESLAVGILGAAVGVGLGYAGRRGHQRDRALAVRRR